MAVLLKEIHRFNASAASVLKEANFRTDAELQTLTREDLNELFPGNGKLKLRRSIYEILHKERTLPVLLGKLNGLMSHEALRASLCSNGLLVDYLHILNELKTQTDNVQGFLRAHIEFLENLHKNPGQRCGEVPPNYLGPVSNSLPAEDRAQVATVKYRAIVHGKTLGADRQLLEKVKGPGQPQLQLQLIDSEKDHRVIIVFCPIATRVESDVKAAMQSSVPRDRPVILVTMYHVREPAYAITNVRLDSHDIVLQVNVFYHDSMKGLLECRENESAVTEIRNKLLEYAQIESRKVKSQWSLW